MTWGDIYSHPENHGLEIFGEAEEYLGYEFDKFVVWKDERGNLYYASDTGCSCPAPFESFESKESLTPLRDFVAFSADLDEWNRGWRGEPKDDVSDLRQRVQAALR